MDRLSRDQEDIAGLYKRMVYSDVKIVTLSEGEVTHLHVGLKGTMNALFLKDLADKPGAANAAESNRIFRDYAAGKSASAISEVTL